MSYRAMDSTLVTSLENNDPHTYVHLIKFEKPSVETEVAYKSGAKPSRRANTYSYLTDGGYPISFDDESVPSDGGTANGTQVYLPGKVISVGTVSETIEAKASTMSVQLAASALSTSVLDTFTITTIGSTTVTGTVDLFEAGFSVGDTVEFLNNQAANHGVYVRIDEFSNQNKTFTYTVISGTITGESNTQYTLSFASEEITALIQGKEATNYSNYLNREVFIYRAHINSSGVIIGKPFVIFKGIITGASFDDNPTKSSKITWTLTSHWGDFVQVSGRITSDHSHRGLDVSGVPSEDAVIRPEYVGDLGFRHAEQAVNIVATYQVPETRYKLKRKGGLSGLFGGKRLVEYTEMVDRDVDLEFNLGSKYIPVIYGVQKATGIPIFADGDVDDAQKVYVAQAISEGPIHGVLDIHIDSNPVICINDADSNDRSAGDAAVLCVGRADRGDVLNGGSSVDINNDITAQMLDEAESLVDEGAAEDIEEAIAIVQQMYGYNNQRETHSDGGAGILHEKKINLDSPLDTELQFHAGLPDQAANSFYTVKAGARKFKVQSILYPDLAPNLYWGPSHQLLDTAYTTMNFTIDEGEFTIPDYEFVVKGRVLDCFNYDHSYSGNGTAHINFKLGDMVTLHKTKDDTQLGSEQVQIIDKWSFYSAGGALKYRFRFSKNLQLQDVREDTNGDVKNFYMKSTDGNSNKWYFASYDGVVEDVQTTPEPISSENFLNLTSITKSTHSSISLQKYSQTVEVGDGVYVTTDSYKFTGMPVNEPQFKANGGKLGFQFIRSDGSKETSTIAYKSYSGSQIFFDNNYNYQLSQIQTKLANASSWIIYAADAVRLSSNSSTTDDEYNDLLIKIERVNTTTGDILHSVEKTIVDYDGSNKIAFLNSGLTFRTNSTDEFKYTILGDPEVVAAQDLFPAFQDKRVSTNPAIQLLDYLTNKRYGKGLDIDNDIDLPSFLSVARTCDEQSKVTILLQSSTAPTEGDKYRYPATGELVFQGTVDSVKQVSYNSLTFQEVTFKDVIGKLIYRWSDYRSFKPNEVLYYEGTAFTTNVSSASGQIINTSTRDSLISSNALNDSSNKFTLTKVGDSNTTIDVFLDKGSAYGTASTNPAVRRSSPTGFDRTGYSLYDSDDCKYWVYLGWDEPEQRYVTRHQTNLTVDTAQSVFSNINAMLAQFGGMLRYSNGKYSLAIKAKAPPTSHFTTDFTAKDISEDEIIGSVKVQDSGSRKTFNSLNATIVDPANKFGGRGITFMNSEYLKQDRGIKKQGNYNIPGISNYFNARMNIKQQLDESRYGLTVKFTLDQKGYLLLAGDIIRLTYSRFGWSNKYFRINSLNFQANGLVQVVAEEHNDTAYIIDHIESSRGAASLEGGSQGTFVTATPGQPSAGDTAPSQDRTGYVELNWLNGANFNPQIMRTEIARAKESANVSSPNSTLSNVRIIAEVQTNNYLDNTHERTTDSENAQATKFDYWVRHRYNTTGTTGSTNRLNQATPWTYLGEGHALPTAQTEIEDGVTIGDGGMTFEGSGNTGAHINSAGTNFSTGNDGFFLGWDNTGQPAHKFFVGDRDGSKLTFDGADLALTGGEFTVTDSGGTVPSISGTTISGAGILLKADGDVLFGDSTGHHIFFDQSEGTITLGGSVVTENITAGEITTEKLAANSITANKIAANSISANEIAANSISANEIAANSISANEIAANSISANEIAANSISANEIAANSIGANEIAANSINSDMITANSVVSSLLTASTIQSSHIKSNSIVSTIIDATTINASDITTTNLSALSADLGAVTAGTMKGGTIPDANSAPSGTESGAFLNLTGGKMVFGNANKYILFDGSDLELNGVTIGADSIVNASATPEITIKEDGTTEATEIAALNFTTGINVAVSGTEATISAENQTPSWVPSTNPNYLTGITTTQVRTAGALMDDELTDLAGVKGVTISTLQVKPSEGAFANGDKTKLDGISAGADVTPSWVPSTNPNYLTGITTSQVRTAGALMDDELTDLAGVKGVTISSLQPKPSEGAFVNGDKTKLDGIATNANNYSLPTATSSVLGGVKIGSGININSGVISAATQSDENFTSAFKTKLTNIEANANNYSLPTATSSVLGGVKIGAGINIDNTGAITASTQSDENFTSALKTKLTNIEANANNYTLPEATSTVLGGVKDGARVTIDANGVLSADVQTANDFTNGLKNKLDNIAENANNYSLPTASATVLGGVKIGSGISISSGTISADNQSDENFTSTLKTKLDNIEANATADQSASEIRTLLGTATSSTSGLVKIGFTETGKNYPVELSSGQMFVNVPWTDNNTTYTAGSGLSLSGSNQFSVDGTVVRTTGAQTIAGNKTFSNNVVVSGNLTVSGTTTYINTQTLNIGDNIITLNADFTGSNPTESAGIEIERGTQANALFQYKESGVGITGDLAAGWSVGTSRIEATGFYGTFYGDASNLSNINADSLSGLSTADLTEDPSATTSSGTMYYTDARVIAALSGGSGIDKSAAGEFAVDSTVVRTSGNQTVGGTKTFTDAINIHAGGPILRLKDTTDDDDHQIQFTDSNDNIVYQISTQNATSGDALTFYSSSQEIVHRIGSSNIFESHANIVKSLKNFDVTGNISVSGTVDGRDLATDGTKLDNIAANATNTAAPAISTNGSTPSLASGITAAEVRSLIGAGTSSLTLGTTSTTALRGDTAIPTVYNPTITLSAGNAGITMDSDNSFTLNQSGSETITISHADTSSQESVDNSSGTVIQDITLDTFGHITAINSVNLDGRYFTETETDARYLRKDSYDSNWTRLGYGSSGTAYWHKLAEVTINGSYKDYQLRCDWTDRYNHGTLNIHIHSDNDNTADIWDAYVQQFGQSNRKPISHFKYYKSGSTVQVWIYTPGWREWDYIRTDAVTEGTPTIVWYKEGDSGVGKTTTEPSSLTEFSDYTPWHPNNDGASSGLDADLLDNNNSSYYLDYNNFTNTPTIPTDTNFYLDGISKSGNTLTFSVNGAANQTYTFGANAFTSTTIPTNNNQLTNGAGYTTNTGTVSSLSDLSITSTAAEINKLDGFTGVTADLNYAKDLRATGVTSTEFDYLDGVTSNIQTQLNGKQASLGFTPYNATNPSGYITNTGGTTASTANTVVKRDSAGDINARLFRSEYDTTNANIGYIMTQINTGTNNYIRPSTLAQVRTSLNVADGADVTPSWVPSTNPNYLTGITSSQVTTALGFTPYNSTNPSGYITNSTASLSGAKITSGTINNARLSTDMNLTDAAPRYRLTESGITNTPSWWMVADGGNYSIRLNNTGTYPLTIQTNTDNNAVTAVNIGYNMSVSGSISVTGTVDGRDVAADGAKAVTAHGWGNHASAGYLTGITSSQVTTALGFTPYNATNPDGYITNSGGTTGSTASTVVKRNTVADISVRAVRLDNKEKSDITIDGQLGFDSSQGLLIRRTQQNVSAATVTVLDGANVAAGTGLSISNLGSGTSGGGTGTEKFTFSLANTAVSAGSYTNADITVDAQGRIIAASNGTGGGTDLTTLTDMTQTITTSDEFVVLDSNAPRRKAASEVISDLNIVTGNVTGTLFADVIVANSIETDMLKANTITADKIAANLITADKIAAASITAEQLQISNNSGGSAGIYMDYNSGNSRIDIRDSSALRVRIGYLA